MKNHLVSCIMPTRGRRELAPKAIECWRSQTYQPTELLIIDDEDDASFPNGIDEPGITYVQDKYIRYNIPQKLNRLCAMASGEIICRFDDDDWSAPGRIVDQLARLLESGLSVSGYHSLVFIDAGGNCRKYVETDYPYALGTSLMFQKSFWAEHPFHVKKSIGSDNFFVAAAREANQLVSVDAGAMMFARVHSGNTSEKKMGAYRRIDESDCGFVRDIEGVLVSKHG